VVSSSCVVRIVAGGAWSELGRLALDTVCGRGSPLDLQLVHWTKDHDLTLDVSGVMVGVMNDPDHLPPIDFVPHTFTVPAQR
jgi:hypothetical protein